MFPDNILEDKKSQGKIVDNYMLSTLKLSLSGREFIVSLFEHKKVTEMDIFYRIKVAKVYSFSKNPVWLYFHGRHITFITSAAPFI